MGEHGVTTQERKAIQRFLSSIGDTPVLLIGSVARGTRSRPDGDIDLLVLSDSGRAIGAGHQLPLHVITLSYDELLGRLIEGDDFAHWALLFGKPLTCRRRWHTLRQQLLSRAPWPRADVKRSRSLSRLAMAAELFAMGDLDAAQEELRFAAGHAARAALLANGVFPLSRPELADQLQAIDRVRLAEVVRTTGLDRSPDKRVLEQALRRLHEELRDTLPAS